MKSIYLYVKQGGISRWQCTSQQETKNYGLFTDRFFNCVIVVLSSKKNNRFVMIHKDTTITLEDLKREIDWVSADCEKIIYYKEHKEAEETLDDLFGKTSKLREQFTLKLIRALRYEDGTIIPDETLPLFHDGSSIPEFEAVVVYVNNDSDSKSYDPYANSELIKDEKKIQAIYKQYQGGTDTYANQQGSIADKMQQYSLEEYGLSLEQLRKFVNDRGLQSNSDFFQESTQSSCSSSSSTSHSSQRTWASSELRAQLYPILDDFSQKLSAVYKVDIEKPDNKFLNKTSSIGWQLFGFSDNTKLLAILNFKDKKTVDSLIHDFSFNTQVTFRCMKSGVYSSLGIESKNKQALLEAIKILKEKTNGSSTAPKLT